jgi:hypothetical protein
MKYSKVEPTMWRAACILVLTLMFSIPPLAAQPAKFSSELNAPIQQSECELAANKFKEAHPKLGMFDKRNTFWMPFGEATPPAPPYAYRDPPSGVTIYVESDGRHVSAIAPSGALLWVRNPFVESEMCPYRSAHPFIIHLSEANNPNYPWPRIRADAPANAAMYRDLHRQVDFLIKTGRLKERPKTSDRYLGLSFNSSQFGYLNIRNGDFYFMGQN